MIALAKWAGIYERSTPIRFAACFTDTILPAGKGPATTFLPATKAGILAALAFWNVDAPVLNGDFNFTRAAGFSAIPAIKAALLAGKNVWIDADSAIKLGGSSLSGIKPPQGIALLAKDDGPFPGDTIPWPTPELAAKSLDPKEPIILSVLFAKAGEVL